MFIHSFKEGVDHLKGFGVVDPNIVSGSDLDARISGYMPFVSDEAMIKLEEELAVATAKVDSLIFKKNELIAEQTKILKQLQSNGRRINEIKALLAGTTGSAPTAQQRVALDAELLALEATQKQLSPEWDLKGKQIGAIDKDVYEAGREVQRVEDEIAILKKHSSSNVSTTTDPTTTTTTTETTVWTQEVPAVKRPDIIDLLGEKIGTSRSQTWFGLGAVALLAVVYITKK